MVRIHNMAADSHKNADRIHNHVHNHRNEGIHDTHNGGVQNKCEYLDHHPPHHQIYVLHGDDGTDSHAYNNRVDTHDGKDSHGGTGSRGGMDASLDTLDVLVLHLLHYYKYHSNLAF